jgi:3-isopropylmalate dehydrogenase
MKLPSNTLRIAVLPGDGIGTEVIAAALAVLEPLAKRHGIGLAFEELRAGAFCYRDTGTAMSDATFAAAAAADAILLGAMGWPEIRTADGTEIAPQLDLRFRLGLFAGLRPVRAIPGVPLALADPRAPAIDFLLIRESTEGLFHSRGRGVVTPELAEETLRITRATTLRLAHASFAEARARAARRARPGTVTLVDKANVFRAFAFMRAVFAEIAPGYAEVGHATHYVDAMALDLVRRPWEFDVLVMENMFGDILSDLAAGLVGGMGFAPSADVGDTHAVFQPAHGTAPDIAGRGLANPTATVLSAAMMLDWLGRRGAGPRFAEAAAELTQAVDAAFAGGLRTPDIGGADGTAAVVRALLARLGGTG